MSGEVEFVNSETESEEDLEEEEEEEELDSVSVVVARTRDRLSGTGSTQSEDSCKADSTVSSQDSGIAEDETRTKPTRPLRNRASQHFALLFKDLQATKDIRRATVDPLFVLSLGANVNNNKFRVCFGYIQNW